MTNINFNILNIGSENAYDIHTSKESDSLTFADGV